MRSQSWLQRRIHQLFTVEDRPFFPKEIKARLQAEKTGNVLKPENSGRLGKGKVNRNGIKDRSLHYALNALIRDSCAQKVFFITPDKPAVAYAKRTDVDNLVAVDGRFLKEDYGVKVSFGLYAQDQEGDYDLDELGDRTLLIHMDKTRAAVSH